MIYLDNCSTTPLDPVAFSRMEPFFHEEFGNAASRWHSLGRRASEAVESARQQVAQILSCRPRDVIWTSGATEANNLALKGAATAHSKLPVSIITQATEHPAVLDSCRVLNAQGFAISILPVDHSGLLQLDALRDSKGNKPTIVSVMWANNETGVIQPIAEIANICESRGWILHTDATQAVGKLPVSLADIPIDLLSMSAHKIYGPKGVGAMIFRRSDKIRRLAALLDGGGHERGFRSGTLNVPGIVGLGSACEIAERNHVAEANRLAYLRDSFEGALCSQIGDCEVNGGGAPRLSHVSNIAFGGVDAERLLHALRDIAASTGSACSSHSPEPSHVLRAMDLPLEQIRSAVRFSFGRFNTQEECNVALGQIVSAVSKLRRLRIHVGEAGVK